MTCALDRHISVNVNALGTRSVCRRCLLLLLLAGLITASFVPFQDTDCLRYVALGSINYTAPVLRASTSTAQHQGSSIRTAALPVPGHSTHKQHDWS